MVLVGNLWDLALTGCGTINEGLVGFLEHITLSWSFSDSLRSSLVWLLLVVY